MILSKYNIKKIFLIIIVSLLLSLFLFNIKRFTIIIDLVLNLINPFLYGFIIAYLLNILVIFFENKLHLKNKRKITILLSIIIIILIITLTLIFIIPNIIKDINIFKKNIPKYLEYINNLNIFDNKYISKLKNININYSKLFKGFTFDYIYKIKNIFVEITNIFLGIILSIIFLYKKESIIKYIKKYFKNKLNKENYNKLLHITNISNNRFNNYIKGIIFENFIISILTFIFMLIFKLPYALSISILIFVTNLIPIIGPFIGMTLSILLILTISLKKTIIFIIIRFVSNQIENYFIRPKILEKYIKLPSILVLISVIYAGLNFGIIGLLLAVPITSIIYEIMINKIYK